MSLSREEFLSLVEAYVEQDPESAAHVANHVQAGLRKSLEEARDRACDMEAALSILANQRYRGKKEALVSVVSKWEGKTSFCWDWLTKENDS